jgi:transcriptional regulator with XRE-family HTH domain
MAIGPILREARLKKQLTESQIAEITRMKVQIVEDLEKDDFHRIAATIYGKGFIKLFAECVDLDPQPLINDYLRSVSGDSPSLVANGPSHKTEQDLPDSIKIKTVAVPENEQHILTNTDAAASDDNEDLFDYSRKQRTIEDDSLQQPAPMPDNSTNAVREFVDKCSTSLQKFMKLVNENKAKLAEKLTDINIGETPIKIAGIAIGILVVALILIIGIKGCSGGSNNNGSDILTIYADPPEPYFD